MGEEKGHSETEIVVAVIRTISLGLSLRDLLEIKRGLTLGKPLTILKGHYKVTVSLNSNISFLISAMSPKRLPCTLYFVQ